MAETKASKQNKKQNNENTNEESSGKRKVSLARADNFALVYADSVQLSISAYDFKLTCSVTQNLLNGEILVTELATIILSPQHAKDLALKLGENVLRYEQDVMPLEINKHFQEEQKKFLGITSGD